jgi:undecaprenyl-diphosphatase
MDSRRAMTAVGELDVGLLRLARTHGHSSRAEECVRRFSALGEHAAIWLAMGTAGVALDPARRCQWRRARATVAAAYGLNTAIKLTVRRRRPQLQDLPPLTSTPSQLGFPSAHTTSATAAGVLYSRLGVPGGPLWALVAAFAYSRLYLGVHYPTDVLAGAALGTVVGTLASAHLAEPQTAPSTAASWATATGSRGRA